MASELTKADLDEMAGRARAVVRAEPVRGPSALYAGQVAGYLRTQFPGVADLPGIVFACAHYASALAAEGLGGSTIVRILAEAGLRIEATDGE